MPSAVVANTSAQVAGQMLALEDSGSKVLQILTADPAAPINNTAWIFFDGVNAISLRLRLAGVTYDLPLGRLP